MRLFQKLYVCACWVIVVLLTQPGIVFVQHVIRWTNLKRGGRALLVVGDVLQSYIPLSILECRKSDRSHFHTCQCHRVQLDTASHQPYTALCTQNSQFRISTEIIQLYTKENNYADTCVCMHCQDTLGPMKEGCDMHAALTSKLDYDLSPLLVESQRVEERGQISCVGLHCQLWTRV